MTLNKCLPTATAAAKAGFSRSTGTWLKGTDAVLDESIAEEKACGRGSEARPEAAGEGLETPRRKRDAGPEMAPERKWIDLERGM